VNKNTLLILGLAAVALYFYQKANSVPLVPSVGAPQGPNVFGTGLTQAQIDSMMPVLSNVMY
jgi:hypothetical protein